VNPAHLLEFSYFSGKTQQDLDMERLEDKTSSCFDESFLNLMEEKSL